MSDIPLNALLDQLASSGRRSWLVGGAVRDQLLGRATLDYDLAIDGDAAAVAKSVGRAADGHSFLLSEEFGAWRVKGRTDGWQIDITPLTADTLEADLRNRDLTSNALARELVPGQALDQGELIDPTGGVRDIDAKLLRAASPTAFSSDPLRAVRLARFAAQLHDRGFTVEPGTTQLAAASSAQLLTVAAERVFQELRQLLCADHPTIGLDNLLQTGAMEVVLPELFALRGLEQSQYHHLDVYGHTLLALEIAVQIERDPARFFPGRAPEVRAFLGQPLANDMSRGEALRFGALLHDIAKTQTREVTPEGRITFFHHDVQGAELSARILTRLRASERLAAHVAALTRHHLRLGFLVHSKPLTRRAIYGYLRTCEPVEVDVTLLSVADRFATLGRNHQQAGIAHLELAQEMLGDALAWNAEPPKPPLRGDVVAHALGIRPGPQLGALLEELAEARYAGEIETEQQCLDHARAWQQHKDDADR